MKLKRICLFNVLFLFIHQAYTAACWGPDCDNKIWAKVISISGGPVWGDAGKSQLFSRPTNDPAEIAQQNQFVADDKTTTFGSGEIFFALQKPIYPAVNGRFGVAVAWTGNAEMSGQMRLYYNSNTAGYQYRLNQTRVALKGLISSDVANWLAQPYLSGSIGIGFNNSYHFGTNPSILLTGPLGINQVYGYEDKTTTGLSYTVGAGLQKNITPNWQVGVGYELADWGKSALDTNLRFPFVYASPNMAHYYTHELQFTLSYIC